ncbi:hypothetical protein AB4305_23175 [Nocardia sp. 2YAB30]|uniref:hypothetical protein n=1 Tax=unclassified Nocardia TaxID=2637762 RepID=UPI003F95E523
MAEGTAAQGHTAAVAHGRTPALRPESDPTAVDAGSPESDLTAVDAGAPESDLTAVDAGAPESDLTAVDAGAPGMGPSAPASVRRRAAGWIARAWVRWVVHRTVPAPDGAAPSAAVRGPVVRADTAAGQGAVQDRAAGAASAAAGVSVAAAVAECAGRASVAVVGPKDD